MPNPVAADNPYSQGSDFWNSFNATAAANSANRANPGSSPYGWYAAPTVNGVYQGRDANGQAIANPYTSPLAPMTSSGGSGSKINYAGGPSGFQTFPPSGSGNSASSSITPAAGGSGTDTSNYLQADPLGQTFAPLGQGNDTPSGGGGNGNGNVLPPVPYPGGNGAFGGTTSGTVAGGNGGNGSPGTFAPGLQNLTQPFTPSNNLPTGYGNSLVPGMAAATLAPEAGTFLQRLLETAQSPYTLHGIAAGISDLGTEVNNIRQNMAQWAAANPDLARQGDWQGAMNTAIQQYVAYVNGQPASSSIQGLPATSLGTGQPLGYSTNAPTGAYDPSTDPAVQGTKGPWMPTLQPNRPGLPGTGLQMGQPATPFNYGQAGDPTLVAASGNNPTGPNVMGSATPMGTPSAGTAANPNQAFLDYLSKLLNPGYQTATTPLGYTQYQQGSNGIDPQLLALLTGILGNSNSNRTSYWNL